MFAGCIGTLNPGDTFRVVSTCNEPFDCLLDVDDPVLKAPPGKTASVLGRGIAVEESMPFAVFSFLRYPGSYRDCLLCAVLNRGDCDTLAAMACGVSGAYLEIEAVPEEWRGRLENRAYIEEFALRLWELGGRH